MTRVASRLCPPSSKKFARAPTCATPSTSAQTAANASSTGPRGDALSEASDDAHASAAGRRRRSIFPPAVSGSSGSTDSAAGTMYSGSTRPRRARNSRASNSNPSRATR
jgi:hypothetical protein